MSFPNDSVVLSAVCPRSATFGVALTNLSVILSIAFKSLFVDFVALSTGVTGGAPGSRPPGAPESLHEPGFPVHGVTLDFSKPGTLSAIID